MDKNLENYFEQEYNKLSSPLDQNLVGYAQQFKREPMADVLENAINNFSASQKSSFRLRADAKVFLYKNFEELVFKPLDLHSNFTRKRLLDDIQSDITQILLEAENIARQNDKTEISSHQILIAVAEKWNVLKTLSKDSW